MKTLLISLLAVAFGLSATAREGWTEDLKAAKEQARKENKKILLNFTGSDWCGWCHKLDAEVFSQSEFKEYAAKNLVLMDVDFPRRKQLSAAVKKQNEGLASKYQIQGYPTIVVLNTSGNKVGELGYVPGGPKAFIKELENAKR